MNTLFPYIESKDMNEANRKSYEAQLKAEVAVLTEMVRVLAAKIAELEAKHD